MEGEAHLWRPGRGGPPLPTSAGHMGHSASDAAAQLATEGQMELDSMDALAAGSREEAQPRDQAEVDGTGAVSAAGENWWPCCRQDTGTCKLAVSESVAVVPCWLRGKTVGGHKTCMCLLAVSDIAVLGGKAVGRQAGDV